MSILTTWILVVSLAALLLGAIYSFIEDHGVALFSFRLLGLAVVCVVLRVAFLFPVTTQAKSGANWDEAYPVIGLYMAMALGMFAQYAYGHFGAPTAKRTAFDWGNFVAPIFLSPIVFIPLYESLKGTPQGHAAVMSLLIAFENGFFFKNFIDQRNRTGGKRVKAKMA